jgi:outer membrane PBP1 activator LpoA protein
MRFLTVFRIVVMACLLAACSDKSPDKGEHVWKEQTDTIKKAEQVNDVLKQSADAQRKQIEEQSD